MAMNPNCVTANFLLHFSFPITVRYDNTSGLMLYMRKYCGREYLASMANDAQFIKFSRK